MDESSSKDAVNLLNELFGRTDFTEADVLRWQLRSQAQEHRREVEPDSLSETLRLLQKLAWRAEKQNSDPALVPGLELLSRTLSDLVMLGEDYEPSDLTLRARQRGDVRERHRNALNCLIPVKLELHTHEALTDVARLPSDGEDDPVLLFKERMGARLAELPAASDAAIGAAIELYRLKPRGVGRPTAGEKTASEGDRAAAITMLVGRDVDARSLRSQRAERDARVETLTKVKQAPNS